MTSSPARASTGTGWPDWMHALVSLTLLALVAVLDVTKLLDRSWSIFYLLPVLYGAWTMRGRAELLVHGAVITTVFMAPSLFNPPLLWSGTGMFNRSLGLVLGATIVLLMWERRRHSAALQASHDELEGRIAARTAELGAANRRLSDQIAERTRAEAQLRQAQKMEAIGFLAGGVAHDFNNWLTVINGYCSTLRVELPADSPWQQAVSEIHNAGVRAAELTRQLLAFSRRQSLQLRVLDVNLAIANAEILVRRGLPEHIALVVSLHSEPLLVEADEGQLGQVLLNLANNARDAMPAGGTFTIRSEPINLSAAQAAGLPGLSAGPHVRLSLSDTGQGMDEETKRHAFEPFFTTKAPGVGTGLGLASVYGIVKQSGGYIDILSGPGRGTTFAILLPASTAVMLPEPVPDTPAGQVAGGSQCILLIEDNDQVRTFTSRTLRDAGYEVWEARDGGQGLSIATGVGAPRFDLVVSDIVMPAMSGPALVERLRTRHTGLKCLFMSGYHDVTLAGHDIGRDPLLEKPFTRPVLLERVQQALRA